MILTHKNSLVILAMSLLFITGCAPGLSDYSYDVAGNYELVRSSAHDIEVIMKDESNVPGKMIPPKVIKIAWNDKYVIAEQQGLKRRSPNNPNDTYEEPDDVFFYWILDAKLKKSYGPFDEKTFEVKKKEFNIPESMELKDVKSYRKE